MKVSPTTLITPPIHMSTKVCFHTFARSFPKELVADLLPAARLTNPVATTITLLD